MSLKGGVMNPIRSWERISGAIGTNGKPAPGVAYCATLGESGCDGGTINEERRRVAVFLMFTRSGRSLEDNE